MQQRNELRHKLKLPRSVSHFFESDEVFVMTPRHLHGFVEMARRNGMTIPRAYLETDLGIERLLGLRSSFRYRDVPTPLGHRRMKMPVVLFRTREQGERWRVFDEETMVLLVLS